MNLKLLVFILLLNYPNCPLFSQDTTRNKNNYNLGVNLAPLTSNSIEVLNDIFISKSFVLGINVGGNYAPGVSFLKKDDGVERLTNQALFLKIIPTWFINTEKHFKKRLNFRV